MHNLLPLFSSTADDFVATDGYVTPNYEKSEVQTFYATLMEQGAPTHRLDALLGVRRSKRAQVLLGRRPRAVRIAAVFQRKNWN